MLTNCSNIQRVTSSVSIRTILTFCRDSPQLILRLHYVSSRLWVRSHIFCQKWGHTVNHFSAIREIFLNMWATFPEWPVAGDCGSRMKLRWL